MFSDCTGSSFAGSTRMRRSPEPSTHIQDTAQTPEQPIASRLCSHYSGIARAATGHGLLHCQSGKEKAGEGTSKSNPQTRHSRRHKTIRRVSLPRVQSSSPAALASGMLPGSDRHTLRRLTSATQCLVAADAEDGLVTPKAKPKGTLVSPVPSPRTWLTVKVHSISRGVQPPNWSQTPAFRQAVYLPPARKTRLGKSPQVPSPICSTEAGTRKCWLSVRVNVSAFTPWTGFEKNTFTTKS